MAKGVGGSASSRGRWSGFCFKVTCLMIITEALRKFIFLQGACDDLGAGHTEWVPGRVWNRDRHSHSRSAFFASIGEPWKREHHSQSQSASVARMGKPAMGEESEKESLLGHGKANEIDLERAQPSGGHKIFRQGRNASETLMELLRFDTPGTQIERLVLNTTGEETPQVRRLGCKIEVRSLRDATLALDEKRPSNIRCQGSMCPSFAPCPPPFPSISACWQKSVLDPVRANSSCEDQGSCHNLEGNEVEQESPFLGQVFLIRRAYVNSKGNVFTKEHYFMHGGCRPRDDCAYPSTTQVTRFLWLVNLVHPNNQSPLTEILTDFLLLEDILRLRPSIPLAISSKQAIEPLRAHLQLMGFNAARLNFHILDESRLFFTHNILQVSSPECERPSRTATLKLRLRLLGYNIGRYNRLATTRTPEQLLRMMSKSNPWSIVVAEHREGSIAGGEDLHAALANIYGARHVAFLPFSATAQEKFVIFQSCILFVGPHSPSLESLLFLSPSSYVLEVRPSNITSKRYRYLSRAADLRHLLLQGRPAVGDGTKEVEVEHIVVRIQQALPPNRLPAIGAGRGTGTPITGFA